MLFHFIMLPPLYTSVFQTIEPIYKVNSSIEIQCIKEKVKYYFRSQGEHQHEARPLSLLSFPTGTHRSLPLQSTNVLCMTHPRVLQLPLSIVVMTSLNISYINIFLSNILT